MAAKNASRSMRGVVAARNRCVPCGASEGQISRAPAASVAAVKQQRRRRAMEFFSGLDLSMSGWRSA